MKISRKKSRFFSFLLLILRVSKLLSFLAILVGREGQGGGGLQNVTSWIEPKSVSLLRYMCVYTFKIVLLVNSIWLWSSCGVVLCISIRIIASEVLSKVATNLNISNRNSCWTLPPANFQQSADL